MAKDIIKNIPLTLDINARKRLNGTVDISLYSKDIATGQFEFTFIDEDGDPVVLDETYSAQALVKYEGSSKTYLNDMIIEGNIIRFIFPHDFITKDGTITMYIYVTKDNYTSDVAAISFPVFVSEIDKDLDPSISVHYIGKIEQLIQDMKDEMSSYQVDVDEIIEGYEESITKLTNLEANYAPELENLTAQLAQSTTETDFTILKANEVNYYDLLTRNSTDIGGHSLKVLGDRNILATIQLTKEESVELELRKNGNDDFIKFRNVHLDAYLSGETVTTKENYSTVIAGNMTSTNGANHYTTVIGTKIEQPFSGTSISMTYYVDILTFRSGVWRCYIDGEHVKDISQHPNVVPSGDYLSSNVARTKIASGLSDTQHTLVIEYVGADTNNPSDTPRGWIRFNDGASGNPSSNLESFDWVGTAGGGIARVQMLYDSNKEFAFSVDVNATNGNRQWFPEHNNLGTLFAGEQTLYIDGAKKSISTPATHPFREAKIIQRLYGRHPSFTGDVCLFITTATINYLGINFETKVEWLQDTYIHNGYVNMFTINPEFGDEMVSSYGGVYDLNVFDNTIEYLDEKIPFYFIALSRSFKDFYATLTSRSPRRTFRFGEVGTGGNEDGTRYHYLQHRSDVLQKLYPVTFQAHHAKAGEVFKFDGHFGFGFLPSVADMI